MAVNAVSEFANWSRKASAAAASTRRWASNSEICAVACDPSASSWAIIASSASRRAAASRAACTRSSISSRAWASARFSASCEDINSALRVSSAAIAPSASRRRANNPETCASNLVIWVCAFDSSALSASRSPVSLEIIAFCWRTTSSLSFNEACIPASSAPKAPTCVFNSADSASAIPKASLNELARAFSSVSSFSCPVMVSCRTNCSTMKMVSTNIKTSNRPVIASTKPGQMDA